MKAANPSVIQSFLAVLGILFPALLQAAPDHSLTFDGINDYVETNTAVIPASGNFTVEFWAECPTATGSYREIISQGSGGNQFFIGADPSNNVRLGPWVPSPAIPYPVGGWHHFALVRSDANAFFYIDGVLKGTKGSALVNPAATTGLRLGRQNSSNGEYWPGSIGDVRVWDRDLGSGELQQPLTSGEPNLVAWWKFEEGTGTTCTSTSKSGLVGTLVNGPFWSGKSTLVLTSPAKAVTFDGVNDYVETGTAVIPSSGDFTVEVWAECPAAPGSHREIISQGSMGNAFYIGTTPTNTIRLGDTWGTLSPAVPMPIGGWHHFALVKSGTNTLFYLDGVLKANRGSAMSNPAASGLRFGRQYGYDSPENWPGSVGDVRIWNRALTYGQLGATLTGSEANLVSWWRFNEGAGTTCTSVGSKIVVGTLTNGPVWTTPALVFTDLGTSVSIIGSAPTLAGELTIPATISGKPVTVIGDGAFWQRAGLTRVTMSDGLTVISGAAFTQCTGLTSVTLPATLNEIGKSAFALCPALTEVTIPASVCQLGDEAFYGCGGLALADFLGNAPITGETVFDNTASGFLIKCHHGATGFSSPTWLGYPCVVVDPEIEVEAPAGIALADGTAAVDFGSISLARSASRTFTIRNTGLAALTGLAASVTGANAGEFTTGGPVATRLEPGASTTCAVSFTTGVAGSRAATLHLASNDGDENPFDIELRGEATPFLFTDDGTSITITGSSPLATGAVDLPATLNGKPVTRIADAAFRDCRGLTSVTIPPGVTSIGIWAFASSGLERVTVAASVTTIGDYAFQTCKGLTSIEFMGDAPAMGAGALDPKNGNLLVVSYHNGATGFTSPTWLGFACDNVDTVPEIAVEQPAGTGLTAGISTVDFGSTPAGGSTSLTFTIRNSGQDALTGLAVTLNGTNGTPDNEYTASDLETTRLEVGETTAFTISFAPLSLGSRTAVVHLASNDADENPFDINLTGESSNFRFTDSGSAITITGCFSATGALTIPATLKGKPVTAIGPSAFSGSSTLTSVTIPATVTDIGLGAFFQCGVLDAITVDGANPNYCSLNGVLFNRARTTLIQCPGHKTGAYAIPAGVTSIGDFSLALCGGLTSVTLPPSVTRIGSGAFYECRGLSTLAVPASATDIGDHAFLNCSGLTSVSLPAGLTRVGNYMLSGCSGLTNVSLPAGVTLIGDYAFSDCAGLTTVVFPASLTTIGKYAFKGCAVLTGAVLPAGVTSIGDCAFYLCGGLTGVTIPAGVVSIGSGAFIACNGLTNLALPASVTSIGEFAFSMCAKLEAITVAGENPNYGSVDGVLYNRAFTTLIQWPGNKTPVGTLPATVTRFGNAAFAFASRLTDVRIPAQVTSIGDYAFQGCGVLISAEFMGNAPAVGSDIFKSVANGFTVKYHNGATGFTPLTWQGYPSDNVDADADIGVEQPAGNGLTDGASTVAFGRVPVGGGTSRTFTIRASGLDGLIGLAATVSGPNAGDFTVSNLGAQGLMPGGSTTFTVTFTPATLGSRTAVLHLASNDPDENPFDITLGGEATPLEMTFTDSGEFITITGFTGSPTGALVIPPLFNGKAVIRIEEAAFLNCVGLTSVTIPASVMSIGYRAFYGCAALTSAEFLGDAPSMGKEVFDHTAPGFKVRYHNGAMDFTPLTWSDYPSDNMETVPEIEVTQTGGTGLTDGTATVGFGTLPVGGGGSRTFTIRNTGLDALTGLAATVTGVHAADFALGSLSATGLLPGGSMTLKVSFAPGGLGPRTAVLHLASDDADENPFDVNLSGEGTPLMLTYTDAGSTITITGTTTAPVGALEIPPMLNGKPVTRIGNGAFAGCAGLTRVVVPASVTDIGNLAFATCDALTSIEFAGDAPTMGTGVFDAGMAARLVVGFHNGAAGFSAPVWMGFASDNLDLDPEITVEQPPGTGLVAGTSTVDFGLVSNRQRTSRTFTIRNTGTDLLTGLAITVTGMPDTNGSEFELGGLDTTTLYPGESTSLTVTMFPLLVGSRTAVLHLASNDSDENPFDINLSAEVSNFVFTDEGTTITINRCVAATGVLNIPATIKGKPVTAIDVAAWSGLAGMTGLTIPAGVTSIGEPMCWDCGGLDAITVDAANPNYRSVDGVLFNRSLTDLLQVPGNRAGSYSIPAGVTRIASGALVMCTKLTSVTIPPGVTSIGMGAFYRCSGLTEISIPTSVTSLGEYAFSESGLTRVTVPATVTDLGSYAFSNCPALASVTVQPGVTRLGNNLFSNCAALREVALPNSLTAIGYNTFDGCGGLTALVLPGSLTTIGDYAFKGCGLTGLALPASVTDIGAFAFQGCDGLPGLTIPAGVVRIGNGAFAECGGLTEVTLSATVASIEIFAFANCSKLNAITVDGANPNFCSVVGVLYDRQRTKLLQWPGNKPFADVIPATVTGIGIGAFAYSAQLTGVTIPAGVTSIGRYAFVGCGRLTSAEFMGPAPAMEYGVFETVARGFTVRYHGAAAGFTAPMWLGYPAMDLDTPTYAAWQTNCFFSFDIATGQTVMDADFDHDGLGNLLEYAFGGNPRLADAAGRAPTSGIAGNHLQIAFKCAASRTDLSYTVQTSVTLAPDSWTDIATNLGGGTVVPIGALSTVADSGVGLRTVTVTYATALSAGTRRFLRIKVSQTQQAPTTYAAWQATNFSPTDLATGLATMAADFDHDGTANLLEYAFAGNPQVAAAAGVSPTSGIVGDHLRIAFKCDASRSDLTYTVQSSTSLAAASWTDIATGVGGATVVPIGSLSTVSDTGTGLRTVTVTDPTAASAGSRRFLRVKVTSTNSP